MNDTIRQALAGINDLMESVNDRQWDPYYEGYADGLDRAIAIIESHTNNDDGARK